MPLNNQPALNQPGIWYEWPPDMVHTTPVVNLPAPETWPLQRENQSMLIEASLLSGHTAFDYQDAGQILAQTLITKGVVDPDYYGQMQDIASLRRNLEQSIGVETHNRSNA